MNNMVNNKVDNALLHDLTKYFGSYELILRQIMYYQRLKC